MLLWFFSGLVMVYSGSTAVTQQDRLVHAQPISLHDVSAMLSVGEVWRLSESQRNNVKFSNTMTSNDHDKQNFPSHKLNHLNSKIIEARLTVLNRVPVWQIEDDSGRHYTLSALNGDVQSISNDSAIQISKAWGSSKTSPQVIKIVEKDLGTRMMMFDPYRPFIKVAIGDSAGTELDISSKTGEVVVVTTQLQRILAYSGEWLHYFRFLDSFGLSDYRKPILTWTSFAACFAVLVGLTVGWLRWRPSWFGARTYNNGQTQPYRESWYIWHFWLGLTGGIITLTWIVSGFLVNNPWEVFTKAKFSQQQLLQFQGGSLPSEMLTLRPEKLLPENLRTVELMMRSVGMESFMRAYADSGTSIPIDSNVQEAKEKALLEAAQRLLPKAKIKDYALIASYDDFYYPNHRKSETERPLPVLRINFNDSASHQVYVDPTEGRILLKIDNSRRVYRWVFHALHNWDLGVLYRRPLWDMWMVFWSLIGLALSITSLYIGWRRMKVSIKNSWLKSILKNGSFNLFDVKND